MELEYWLKVTFYRNEGNIFTGVYHSVQKAGVGMPGFMSLPGRVGMGMPGDMSLPGRVGVGMPGDMSLPGRVGVGMPGDMSLPGGWIYQEGTPGVGQTGEGGYTRGWVYQKGWAYQRGVGILGVGILGGGYSGGWVYQGLSIPRGFTREWTYWGRGYTRGWVYRREWAYQRRMGILGVGISGGLVMATEASSDISISVM